MITEVLIVKGLIAIGHFVAAHATAGTIATAAHAVAGMSLAQIATATITAGFVAGCITWTGDRIKNVQNGIKAINDGNSWTAVKEFGSLALSADIDIVMLPDTVKAGLEKMNLDSKAAHEVTSWVKNHEIEIAKYVSEHK